MPYVAKGEFMFVSNRGAFAMIMAIFVVVLVALGGVMLLGQATSSNKSIGDKYMKAQAELLAMSATEFAVMRVQGFDTSGGNCLNTLNIAINDSSNASAYDANVTLQYSFNGVKPNNQCSTLAENTGIGTTILVDVTVSSNTTLSTEAIRVHKRTWQKL